MTVLDTAFGHHKQMTTAIFCLDDHSQVISEDCNSHIQKASVGFRYLARIIKTYREKTGASILADSPLECWVEAGCANPLAKAAKLALGRVVPSCGQTYQ